MANLVSMLESLGSYVTDRMRDQKFGPDYAQKVAEIKARIAGEQANTEGKQIANETARAGQVGSEPGEDLPTYMRKLHKSILDKNEGSIDKLTYGPTMAAPGSVDDIRDGSPINAGDPVKPVLKGGKLVGYAKDLDKIVRGATGTLPNGLPEVGGITASGQYRGTGMQGPARGSYITRTDEKGNETAVPAPPVYIKPPNAAAVTPPSGPGTTPKNGVTPQPTPATPATPGGISKGNPKVAARNVAEEKLSPKEGDSLDSIYSSYGILDSIEKNFKAAGLDPNDNSVMAAAQTRGRALQYSLGFKNAIANATSLVQEANFLPLDTMIQYGGVRMASNQEARKFILAHMPNPQTDTPAMMYTKLQDLRNILKIREQGIRNRPRHLQDVGTGGSGSQLSPDEILQQVLAEGGH